MKLLIAYDGSESADIAIEGLMRAGLPSKNVEAVVVSVAEVWLPLPAQNEVLDDTFPLQIPQGLKHARERAATMIADAEEVAQRGRKRVQQALPEWSVTHEVKTGSPAFELLNHAEQYQPFVSRKGSRRDRDGREPADDREVRDRQTGGAGRHDTGPRHQRKGIEGHQGRF